MAWIAGVVLSSIVSAAAYVVSGADPDQEPIGVVALSLVALWGGWMGVLAVGASSRGLTIRGWVRDALGLVVRPIDLVVGPLTALATSFFGVPLLYQALIRLGAISEEQFQRLGEPAQELRAGAPGAWYLVLVLFIAIGAPVAEECFFRGALQRPLERRFGGAIAVAISSVVFGVTHLQVLQLPALLLFGVVLGVLVERSGRLGPAITAHIVFNGLTLAHLALG